MNWLLILVLVVIGVCGFAGYRKGLVRVLFSLLAVVLSLVFVGFVFPFVGTLLQEHTGLHAYVKERSNAMVAEWNESREVGTEEGRYAAIDSYEVPEYLKSYFKKGHTTETLETEFNDYISDKIAELAINVVSFVISFLVIAIVLHALAFLLDTVMKLPILNSINRIGGLAAGLAEGLLAVWIFFLVITFLCSTEFGKECMRLIDNGKILSLLYNENLLMRLFL